MLRYKITQLKETKVKFIKENLKCSQNKLKKNKIRQKNKLMNLKHKKKTIKINWKI